MKKLFKRPCRRCEEIYQPVGKYQDICPKCNRQARNLLTQKMRKLREEAKKIKDKKRRAIGLI